MGRLHSAQVVEGIGLPKADVPEGGRRPLEQRDRSRSDRVHDGPPARPELGGREVAGEDRGVLRRGRWGERKQERNEKESEEHGVQGLYRRAQPGNVNQGRRRASPGRPISKPPPGEGRHRGPAAPRNRVHADRAAWRSRQGNADLRSAQPAGGGRQGRTPSSGLVRLSAGTLAFSIIRTAAWYTPFAALRAAVPAPTGRTGRRSAFPCQRAVLPGGVGAETCAMLALGSTPSRPAARGGAGEKPPPGELAGVPGPHRENCQRCAFQAVPALLRGRRYALSSANRHR